MSGIGLNSVYVTPELKAAQDFNAAAQSASSAPPGIGLKTSGSVTPPAAVTTASPPTADMPTLDTSAYDPPPPSAAPAPAPAASPQEKPLIDFHQDPMGAIGLVLSNFAAGMRGQELPSDKMRAAKIAEQAQQYKTASLGLEVIGKYEGILSKAPPADHPAIIQHAQEMFGKAVGGMDFKPILNAFSDGSIKNAKAKLQAAAQYLSPQALALFANDPEGLDKVLTSVMEKKEGQEPPKTPEQIFKEAEARAKGERAGNPPRPEKQTRRFALVNGTSQFLTDDEILSAQHGGAKVEPVSDQPKPMNESQANSATFADRAEQAEGILGTLDAPEGGSRLNRMGDKLPAGFKPVTTDFKKAKQAEINFLTAVLRKESGASIQPSEFDTGNTLYFVQPGDDAALVKQKAATRRAAIEGLKRGAGPQYPGSGGTGAVVKYDKNGKRL